MSKRFLLFLLLGVAVTAVSVNAGQIANFTSPFASSSTVTLGSGSGTGTLCAVASVNTTAVGNVGGGEDDLITYSLPANSLSTNGSFVRVTAWGTTAANGNSKTITLYFGATAISTRGAAVYNNNDWKFSGVVVRTSATAQEATGEGGVNGNGENWTRSTPAETLANAITIKMTGTSAGSATDDVVQRGMIVEVCNQ